MYMRYAAAALLVCGTASAQSSSTTGNEFNPAIGLILQGSYSERSDDYPGVFQPGLLSGGEAAEEASEGFTLDESELFLGANIDNWFYGEATVALRDGEAEIEEAYFRTLTLPQGLSLQAGKFLSGVGYQNARHAHTWDFIDQPLAYELLLGGQYKDPGVQLTWVAPTPIFMQLGVEAMRGETFPAADGDGGGTGATTAFLRLGGDVGMSHSWQASLGNLHYDATRRATITRTDTFASFTGSGDVSIAGLVWKWSPRGNWHARNAVFQAEYLRRDEDGEVTQFPGNGRYDGVQEGWYVQGVYQWMPRWRAGLRYDAVHADNTVQGRLRALGDFLPAADSPRRISAMLDYSNSEFSRLRLQVNRARGAEGEGTAVFLQYIMSVGAHGAHTF